MKINIHNVNFVKSVVNSSGLPKDNLPQVAFVGRSNVGKSSILNALLNRKKLAYTGSTPGKTRQINIFNIDEKLYFVDLPGYSFALMSKEEKNKISPVIDKYLSSTPSLKLVIMLMDIRHIPTKDDILMYNFLINSKLNFFIALTKSDKLAPTKVDSYCHIIQESLNIPDNIDIIPVSCLKKTNIDLIWQSISEII